MLWFGAGYKLYQVDLNQQIAKVVYDTKDVVISFIRIDGERLFFGGYRSPHYNSGVIWSLDTGELAPIKWTQNMSRSSRLGRTGAGSWTKRKQGIGSRRKSSN